jgi:hypothetical protein
MGTTNIRRIKPVMTELTQRLISAESMASGLDELLSKLLRYTLIIDRPSFSWETAQSQSPNVVLFEDEKPIIDGAIDPRLFKARRVTLMVTSSDRGVASIDLTSRRILVSVSTDELRNLIKDFNERLLAGARSRWFTPQAVASLVTTTVLAIAMPIVVDIIVNPKVRHIVNSGNSNRGVPWDAWVSKSTLIVAIVAIVPTLMAVIISVIRTRSGSLRVWPGGLTLRAFAQTVYKIRISDTLRKNISSIAVGVVTAVIVLWVGKIF